MLKYIKSGLILTILSFMLFGTAYSQHNISNVQFVSKENRVVIYYDLSGDRDEEYEVEVTLRREDDPSFVYEPENLSGDLGEGEYVGVGRKIVWEPTEGEKIRFTEDDYYFVLSASPAGGGMGWLLWVGGAAVLGGGAAAIIVLGSETTDPAESSDWIVPPDRP